MTQSRNDTNLSLFSMRHNASLVGLLSAAMVGLATGCMAELDLVNDGADSEFNGEIGEAYGDEAISAGSSMNADRVAATGTEIYAIADESHADSESALANLNSCSSSNLALSGSTSASSTFCSGSGLHCYHPYRINDGSPNTTVGGYYSWANSNTNLPQWVAINFGTTRTFNRLELYTSAGFALRDYQLQYWNGLSWSTIVTVYNNTQTHRTHRFSPRSGSQVRVLGLKGPSNQPQYVRVNELEVYNDCNIALGASTSASSTFCSGSGLHCYHPYRINDSSTNTTVGGYYSWTNSNTSLPQWVAVNFGTNKSFGRVELYTSSGYAIQDYKIQYFSGGTWHDIVSIIGNTSVHRSHTFPTKTGSQVRVLGLKGPANQPQYVRVNELEVY